jgi:hypothetical protein
MAYKNKDEYRAYQNEYAKKNLVMVMVKLHRDKDKDILDALDDNKAGSIKRLVRVGLGKIK